MTKPSHSVKTVLVTVGSDHHPFQRLMLWVEDWLADTQPNTIRCLVQHGTASPPKGAIATAYYTHDELMDLMDSADLIVTSGGPATVMEARRRRHVPIVVPRQAELGEHVDDHQLAFARHLGKHALAVPVLTDAEFRRAVAAALAHQPSVNGDRPEDRDSGVARRIGEIVDEVGRRHRSRARGVARRRDSTTSTPR